MERLRRLFLEGEDSLVRQVQETAGARGYAPRLPALEQGHRSTIAALTAHLLEALALEGVVRPLSATACVDADPAFAFGAHLHRSWGTITGDPCLMLGMVKCYRAAYLELLSISELDQAGAHRLRESVGRFFDRVETGVVAQGSGSDPHDRATSADRRRNVVADRDRYLKAFSRLPLPALLLDMDGCIAHMNEAAHRLFRPTLAKGAGSRPIREASRWTVPKSLSREIVRFIESSEEEASFEHELKTLKGLRHYQVCLTMTAGPDGSSAGVLVVLNDLTYRKHAEEALRRSQARYVSLFENMPMGFVHAKVTLDRFNSPDDHLILECNPAFERLVGSSASALVGRSFIDILEQLDTAPQTWARAMARAAVSGETDGFETHLGSTGRWLSVTAFSPGHGHAALLISDITDIKAIQDEQRRHHEALEQMATLDRATGLASRRLFEDALRRAAVEASRGRDTVLLLVGVLASGEDVHGVGEWGRAVMGEVGKLLNAGMRSDDLVALVAPDVFGVLLAAASIREAEAVAQRLLEAMRAAYPSADKEPVVISIGGSPVRPDSEPADVLLKADTAMRRVHEDGGGRYECEPGGVAIEDLDGKIATGRADMSKITSDTSRKRGAWAR